MRYYIITFPDKHPKLIDIPNKGNAHALILNALGYGDSRIMRYGSSLCPKFDGILDGMRFVLDHDTITFYVYPLPQCYHAKAKQHLSKFKGLGWRQRHIMSFRTKVHSGSLDRSKETRLAATKLEERGLITINRSFECWTIRFKYFDAITLKALTS
jgi:hypothetical protein